MKRSTFASSIGGGGQLVLSESPELPSSSTPWVSPMVLLGDRVARYHRGNNNQQLIVVLSVPQRDFAAVLVGCGWVLASKAPTLPDPLAVLREMQSGEPLRAVTKGEVITGLFSSLNESVDPPQAYFAGARWRVDCIRAVAALEHDIKIGDPLREPYSDPGSIEHMADLDDVWDARLACPTADLAIVGTLKWLEQDFNAYLAKEEDIHPPSLIRSLLMPKTEKSATWFTHLFSSAVFADNLPLPKELKAVILDGNRAIVHLVGVEAPVVVCVLDRSVADESAAELVVQLRNTRGEPLSLSDDLRWSPPAGVEALAFTVPL